jgi:metal-responsive CopG/Arc/MetJ family transcriptional regulator
MMKTHKKTSDFADSYVGFRLANDLNELLIRAAGSNRSAFIRNAIKLHILAKAEDEKVLGTV